MLYQQIHNLLCELQISFSEIQHEASTSCDHSKELRSKAWLVGVGSKNIVFHAKWNFYVVTTLWDKDIKARNFKHEFGTKDIRFASQEEISAQIGAAIGSIPPFGFSNKTIPVYVDEEIFSHEFFCFNPWDPTLSVQISTEDLRKVYTSLQNPCTFFRFTEDTKEFTSLTR